MTPVNRIGLLSSFIGTCFVHALGRRCARPREIRCYLRQNIVAGDRRHMLPADTWSGVDSHQWATRRNHYRPFSLERCILNVGILWLTSLGTIRHRAIDCQRRTTYSGCQVTHSMISPWFSSQAPGVMSPEYVHIFPGYGVSWQSGDTLPEGQCEKPMTWLRAR